jgi:hypothetical protein
MDARGAPARRVLRADASLSFPKSARFRPWRTFSRVLTSFRRLGAQFYARFSYQSVPDYYRNYYTKSVGGQQNSPFG